MARRFGRAPSMRAAATIVACACFTAVLTAAPSLARASPIAIISKGDDSSDAFTKVIGALCEKKKKSTDEESEDESNLCRHFEDEREVSSLLTRNAEAFAAIVSEVRGFEMTIQLLIFFISSLRDLNA